MSALKTALSANTVTVKKGTITVTGCSASGLNVADLSTMSGYSTCTFCLFIGADGSSDDQAITIKNTIVDVHNLFKTQYVCFTAGASQNVTIHGLMITVS